MKATIEIAEHVARFLELQGRKALTVRLDLRPGSLRRVDKELSRMVPPGYELRSVVVRGFLAVKNARERGT